MIRYTIIYFTYSGALYILYYRLFSLSELLFYFSLHCAFLSASIMKNIEYNMSISQ